MVKKMKRHFFKVLIPVFVLLLFGTCSDPIFHEISIEVPIVPPRIAGSPTNFAVYDGSMYVATGNRLWRYNETEKWNSESINGRRILGLAALGTYFYAICEANNGRGVLLKKNSNTWEPVDVDGKNVQGIYVVNVDQVFACVSASEGKYDVYNFETSVNSAGSSDKYLSSVAYLNGVVYNGSSYFLCTEKGIYKDNLPITDSSGINFAGIINLTSTITVAIARNGNLYNVSASSFSSASVGLGSNRRATGALAIWTDGTDYLLLAGGDDLGYSVNSGFAYGYMELVFDSSGVITGNFKTPDGSGISTVTDDVSYNGTIGRNPIKHIFQAPADIDSKKVIFASTQLNGVWSYRERGDKKQWNAER